MNKLTGKAYTDFLNFSDPDEEDRDIARQYFEIKTVAEQNGLIVEWLDAVNIYINIKSKFGQRNQCERFSYTVRQFNSGYLYNSRQKAELNAIKFANDIYNKQQNL